MTAPEPRLLLAGSSIFEQWKTAAQAFPWASVQNAAIGGTTTADWRDQLAGVAQQLQPTHIAFYCGSNDVSEGRSATEIIEGVLACREAVADWPFAWFTIIHAPEKRSRLQVVDDVITGVRVGLAADPTARVVDLSRVFPSDTISPPDFFIADGLHLTPPAYRAIEAHCLEQFQAW